MCLFSCNQHIGQYEQRTKSVERKLNYLTVVTGQQSVGCRQHQPGCNDAAVPQLAPPPVTVSGIATSHQTPPSQVRAEIILPPFPPFPWRLPSQRRVTRQAPGVGWCAASWTCGSDGLLGPVFLASEPCLPSGIL